MTTQELTIQKIESLEDLQLLIPGDVVESHEGKPYCFLGRNRHNQVMIFGSGIRSPHAVEEIRLHYLSYEGSIVEDGKLNIREIVYKDLSPAPDYERYYKMIKGAGL